MTDERQICIDCRRPFRQVGPYAYGLCALCAERHPDILAVAEWKAASEEWRGVLQRRAARRHRKEQKARRGDRRARGAERRTVKPPEPITKRERRQIAQVERPRKLTEREQPAHPVRMPKPGQSRWPGHDETQEHSHSVHAYSGGLPTLGKRRKLVTPDTAPCTSV